MQSQRTDRDMFAGYLDELGVHVSILGDGFHADDRGWEHHRFRVLVARAGFDADTTVYSEAGDEIGGKVLETTYRQGTGIDRDPEPIDVIAALLRDANSFTDTDSLEVFLEEFGYLDTGRDALRGIDAYNACKPTAYALESAFSTDELQRLAELADEAGL